MFRNFIFILIIAVSCISAETIGYAAVSRTYHDSATYINFIDTDLVFSEDAVISSWTIHGYRTDSLYLQVYRHVSNNIYRLIGENLVQTNGSGLQNFSIATQDQIQVQAGDIIGWRFLSAGGTISFNSEDPVSSVHWSSYPNNNVVVGGTINFGSADRRTYSIQAHTSDIVNIPEPGTLLLLLIATASFVILNKK